jgi:hypothetical protein
MEAALFDQAVPHNIAVTFWPFFSKYVPPYSVVEVAGCTNCLLALKGPQLHRVISVLKTKSLSSKVGYHIFGVPSFPLTDFYK